MKAITLWQPHASLIAVGLKSIETRTHDRFRSLAGRRIAIHSAKRKPTPNELNTIGGDLQMLGLWTTDAWPQTWLARRPLGKILCTARVARFGRLTDAEHAKAACCHIDTNRFGLFLEDVRKLEKPIPWKGGRGIWTVPDEVIHEHAR